VVLGTAHHLVGRVAALVLRLSHRPKEMK
jgi:hypothetical protein